MQLTENSDEIVIRHVPVREWIIGGFLTFLIGVFCLFLLFAILSAPRGFYESMLGEWLGFLSFLFVAVIFLVVVFFEIKIIRAPLATVVINRKNARFDVVYQRFYGTKSQRFYFYQIQKFKSYKGKLIFKSSYFLAVVLANKKVIKLKMPIGNDKQDITKFIKKLNKFVKSKEPVGEN